MGLFKRISTLKQNEVISLNLLVAQAVDRENGYLHGDNVAVT